MAGTTDKLPLLDAFWKDLDAAAKKHLPALREAGETQVVTGYESTLQYVGHRIAELKRESSR